MNATVYGTWFTFEIDSVSPVSFAQEREFAVLSPGPKKISVQRSSSVLSVSNHQALRKPRVMQPLVSLYLPTISLVLAEEGRI